MKILKTFTKGLFNNAKNLRETGLVSSASSSIKVSTNVPYLNESYSKHKNFLSLYDLEPGVLLNTFVAPNASLVGEVIIGSECAVWYNVVIRGDINRVSIGNNTNIGENTVIHTAGSLPTGMPASVDIGSYVTIQHGCTLYSCTIDSECLIGFKSVILEGARVEEGSVIGPNSVVPPGRIIPSHQLWAGNPVEYVRDLTKGEIANLINTAKVQYMLGTNHKYEFLPYNSAYLQKENTENDLEPTEEDSVDAGIPGDFGADRRANN